MQLLSTAASMETHFISSLHSLSSSQASSSYLLFFFFKKPFFCIAVHQSRESKGRNDQCNQIKQITFALCEHFYLLSLAHLSTGKRESIEHLVQLHCTNFCTLTFACEQSKIATRKGFVCIKDSSWNKVNNSFEDSGPGLTQSTFPSLLT